ncbi:hypothetical protein [Erwinia sp. E_sp_B01_9]
MLELPSLLVGTFQHISSVFDLRLSCNAVPDWV